MDEFLKGEGGVRMERFTVFPMREVVIVARHESVGDGRFCGLLEQALLQMLASEGGVDQGRFLADNGVTLQVKGTVMLLPEEVEPLKFVEGEK